MMEKSHLKVYWYNQVLKINSKKLFFRFSEFKLAIFEQEQNIVIDEK